MLIISSVEWIVHFKFNCFLSLLKHLSQPYLWASEEALPQQRGSLLKFVPLPARARRRGPQGPHIRSGGVLVAQCPPLGKSSTAQERDSMGVGQRLESLPPRSLRCAASATQMTPSVCPCKNLVTDHRLQGASTSDLAPAQASALPGQ